MLDDDNGFYQRAKTLGKTFHKDFSENCHEVFAKNVIKTIKDVGISFELACEICEEACYGTSLVLFPVMST